MDVGVELEYDGYESGDNKTGDAGDGEIHEERDEDGAILTTTTLTTDHLPSHLNKKPPPRSTPELQEKLNDLLYLLFTQTPTSELRGNFFSPVSHYIILASMRKRQQWLAAGSITHNIAAILFTGRLVFARRIMEVYDDGELDYAA